MSLTVLKDMIYQTVLNDSSFKQWFSQNYVYICPNYHSVCMYSCYSCYTHLNCLEYQDYQQWCEKVFTAISYFVCMFVKHKCFRSLKKFKY